ncbi:hypothetical protein [Halorubellus salinus]|uniref:hypothetical protein n=1 Tax=Halorubellus salinus TaxID=755309 RepID=UPI001D089226|nr:hypothetical protein [Halorubellus salinus]
MGLPLRRVPAFGVDVVALAAVVVHPFPLYVVLAAYWLDLLASLVRMGVETAVAAPRETYSPTVPPAVHRNGDPGAFRFLTPKLGRLRPASWLPSVAPGNVAPTLAAGLAAATAGIAVAVAGTVVDPPFSVLSWPTNGVLAAGALAVAVKHGVVLRRFLSVARVPADRTLRLGPWLGSVLLALPVVAVDAVHADAGFDPTTGFAALAVVIVAGRVAVELRRDARTTRTEPFRLPDATGRPVERFQVDRRAVRIAGLLDGVVPRLDRGVLNVTSRLLAVLVLASAGFLAAGALGRSPAGAAGVAVTAALAVTATTFGLAGVVHFDLAFGATEYHLYDDELVAYDRRLDAVQWRASFDEVRGVSVEDGFWRAPPGTDAATVTLDRTDLDTDASPYGFSRQTLAYVDRPERVADRLRHAIAD